MEIDQLTKINLIGNSPRVRNTEGEKVAEMLEKCNTGKELADCTRTPEFESLSRLKKIDFLHAAVEMCEKHYPGDKFKKRGRFEEQIEYLKQFDKTPEEWKSKSSEPEAPEKSNTIIPPHILEQSRGAVNGVKHKLTVTGVSDSPSPTSVSVGTKSVSKVTSYYL